MMDLQLLGQATEPHHLMLASLLRACVTQINSFIALFFYCLIILLLGSGNENDVTMYHCLSLAEHISRMIPDPQETMVSAEGVLRKISRVLTSAV